MNPPGLTAAQLRDIPPGCECAWEWTAPGMPWVRIKTSRDCTVHPGTAAEREAADLAGHRHLWELRAADARTRLEKAGQDLQTALDALQALDGTGTPS